MAWADKPLFFPLSLSHVAASNIFRYDCFLVNLEVVADTRIVVRKAALKRLYQLLPREGCMLLCPEGKTPAIHLLDQNTKMFPGKKYSHSPSMLIFSCQCWKPRTGTSME